MNEALRLRVGHKVLEIGSGSGWHASTVAEIIAPSNLPKEEWGHVYTVEIISELAAFAQENIREAGYDDRITIVCGDGSLGLPSEAPFDRIYVTASAPDIPKPLTEQLKIGGLLVIPVGSLYFFQDLVLVEKEASGSISKRNLGGVAFVPLTGKYGWKT